MPIYGYRCSECGQEHEALRKLSESPLTLCPACGKPGLQKLLSAAGFHLKGSGWYATDFKNKPKPAAEKKVDADAAKKADAKAEAKTETKTEEKKSDPKPAPAPATSD